MEKIFPEDDWRFFDIGEEVVFTSDWCEGVPVLGKHADVTERSGHEYEVILDGRTLKVLRANLRPLNRTGR